MSEVDAILIEADRLRLNLRVSSDGTNIAARTEPPEALAAAIRKSRRGLLLRLAQAELIFSQLRLSALTNAPEVAMKGFSDTGRERLAQTERIVDRITLLRSVVSRLRNDDLDIGNGDDFVLVRSLIAGEDVVIIFDTSAAIPERARSLAKFLMPEVNLLMSCPEHLIKPICKAKRIFEGDLIEITNQRN